MNRVVELDICPCSPLPIIRASFPPYGSFPKVKRRLFMAKNILASKERSFAAILDYMACNRLAVMRMRRGR